MITDERKCEAAFWLTSAAASAVLVSIAVSQILLGLAILALIWSRQPWRLPPLKLPLALFLTGTVVAVLASGHIREGWPQIKKMYDFMFLVAVYSTFRNTVQLRRLVLIWTGIGALAAVLSAEQFLTKVLESQRLGSDFYLSYIGRRTTGFMSHWMTFSGEQMIVLMLLLSLLLFAARKRHPILLWLAAALLAGSLILSYTRNTWLGALAGVIYLLWVWRPLALLAVPVSLAILLIVAPPPLRDRISSLFGTKKGDADSNRHRIYTFRTGVRMVEAHPWLGIGPEQINREFDHYLPPDLSPKKPEGYYGHLHNIYLQFAAERGIPTLLCLLWLIGKAVYDFSRAALRKDMSPDGRFFLYGAVGVIIAVLVAGMFEYNLGDSEVLMLFLSILAGGYVAIRDGLEPVHVE